MNWRTQSLTSWVFWHFILLIWSFIHEHILKIKWCLKAWANRQQSPASIPSLRSPSPFRSGSQCFQLLSISSVFLNDVIFLLGLSTWHHIDWLLIVLDGGLRFPSLCPPNIVVSHFFCFIHIHCFHYYCQ